MDEAANPDRAGIYMHVLKNVIAELEGRPELQEIFGVPVSRALVLVADNNDLRIEDGGRVNLTDEHEETFLRILDEVIRDNAV